MPARAGAARRHVRQPDYHGNEQPSGHRHSQRPGPGLGLRLVAVAVAEERGEDRAMRLAFQALALMV